MQPVHGDGHALVGLFANGAVAHSARVEAAHDARRILHLVKGDGVPAARIKIKQVAQAHRAAGPMQMLAIGEEGVKGVLAHSLLQEVDGVRVNEVVFAAHRTPLREAKAGQGRSARAPAVAGQQHQSVR